MSDNSNHTDLFDRYLRRELTDSERAAFEQRLGSDMAFKEAFDLHSLLSEGIREAGRAELRQYLKTHTPAGAAPVKPIRRMYYAAAAVAVLGVCLYLVNLKFGASSLKEQKSNTIVLNDEQQDIAPAPAEQKQETADSAPQPAVKFEAPEIVRDEAYRGEADIVQTAPDDADMLSKDVAEPPPIAEAERATENLYYKYQTAPALNSSDEVVLSDKKTFDTTLYAVLVPVDAYSSYSNVFTNQAGNTRYRNKIILPRNSNVQNERNDVQAPAKADTAEQDRKVKVSKKSKEKAESKEEEEQTPEYVIEFWKSPLNYRGYAFKDNVIQLFGLTAKEVKLLQYDNKFYLKADNEYFLLEPTEKYQPYKPVIETPVIKQLSTY